MLDAISLRKQGGWGNRITDRTIDRPDGTIHRVWGYILGWEGMHGAGLMVLFQSELS